MAFTVPPPIRISVAKKVEDMEPFSDQYFPNPPESVKVSVSRIRTAHEGQRRYMTKAEGSGTRVWRFE